MPGRAEAVVPEHGAERLVLAIFAAAVRDDGAAQPELPEGPEEGHYRDRVLWFALSRVRGGIDEQIFEALVPRDSAKAVDFMDQRSITADVEDVRHLRINARLSVSMFVLIEFPVEKAHADARAREFGRQPQREVAFQAVTRAEEAGR